MKQLFILSLILLTNSVLSAKDNDSILLPKKISLKLLSGEEANLTDCRFVLTLNDKLFDVSGWRTALSFSSQKIQLKNSKNVTWSCPTVSMLIDNTLDYSRELFLPLITESKFLDEYPNNCVYLHNKEIRYTRDNVDESTLVYNEKESYYSCSSKKSPSYDDLLGN